MTNNTKDLLMLISICPSFSYLFKSQKWQTSIFSMQYQYTIKRKDCENLRNNEIQSTPDNSNLQGKSKKVWVIGSSSYWELEENSQE